MRTSCLVLLGLCWTAQALATSPPLPNDLQAGHSAIWYDEEDPGTGWIVEIFEDDRGLAFWYGFDTAGNPVWQGGAGEIVGDRLTRVALEIDGLYAGSGARFGDAFDPADVVLERVAEDVAIAFWDCESGLLWLFEEDSTEAPMPLDRLTRTMGAGCEPLNGRPGFPVRPHAGQSGTWFDPNRNGEGISLQWLDRDEAVFVWFTYDLEGNALWLFGVGAREDDVIVFPEIYSPRQTPDGETLLTVWGRVELAMECQSATLVWDSDIEGFGTGLLNLVRLTSLAGVDCPSVAPSLSDLYDLAVREVPVPAGRIMQMRDITDDGTILALEQTAPGFPEDGQLSLLAPNADEWQLLGGPLVIGERPAFLSSNGSRAYANLLPQEDSEVVEPLEWRPGDGWGVLPDLGAPYHLLLGASQDRSVLTGFTENEADMDETQAWSWSATAGRLLLPPLDEPTATSEATAASNDGRIVIGFDWLPILAVGTPFHYTGTRALRWRNGVPELMQDDQGFDLVQAIVCSEDCGIVYGEDTNGVERESDRVGQPWFLTDRGLFGVLEGLEYRPGQEGQPWKRHHIQSTSADGSIVLGTSIAPVGILLSPAPPPPDAFLWTQATGLVWISELLDSTGLVDPDSAGCGIHGISMSGDGRQILLESCRVKSGAFVVSLNPREEQ